MAMGESDLKKVITLILIAVMLMTCFSGCKAPESGKEKTKIKALILPKFEVGEMSGDAPGEAQFYYDEYCVGGEVYDISGGCGDNKLYVKNGVALYLTGMGKVNASLSVAAIISDDRFDFSDGYVIGTGCAGAAYENSVMGDVCVISAVVDFDLGHHVDHRDMAEQSTHPSTWYRDSSYDDFTCKTLDPELTGKVYELVKGVKINTTVRTREAMASAFNNESWAIRDPKVLKGTSVTSDSYWKGMYLHDTALYVVDSYGCKDPFTTSEMEDMGIAIALERVGMLDRLIIIRDAVNMDVFMNGDTPDSLWDPNYITEISSDSNKEVVDIFATAMENNFIVGKVIIDAILNGTL